MTGNPFPGLRPYKYSESDLFFGREDSTYEILERLGRTHFLAVVGPSGGGKSSLIRAGVLPAMQTTLSGDEDAPWRVVDTHPGNNPIAELAFALQKPAALGPLLARAGAPEPLWQSILRRGPSGLVEVTRAACLPEGNRLLVLVDQFEELFRFVREEAGENDARTFVKLLLEASAQNEFPIFVLLTMRTDFLGACARFAGLPEAINHGIYLVPEMRPEQIIDSIREPVLDAGKTITDRLVNRLLNDMGDETDRLPLLQHTLMRMWSAWAASGRDEPIDIDHYMSVGRVGEALDRHAEETYNSLSLPQQITAKAIFLRITSIVDNQMVRRPRTLQEIVDETSIPEEAIREVCDQFRREDRSFISPAATVPLESWESIDISHETLIRQWKRLRRWVEEEDRHARLFRLLHDNAVSWQENGKRPEELYSGARLGMVEEVTQRGWPPLSSPDKEFFEESVRRRRRKHRIRLATAAGIGLILVLLGLDQTMGRFKAEKSATFAQEKAARDSVRADSAVQLEAVTAEKLNMAVKQVDAANIIDQRAPRQKGTDFLVRITGATDADSLLQATLTRLGFRVKVDYKPVFGPEPLSNCLWYGAAVPRTARQDVALAVIRAGIPLRGLFPEPGDSSTGGKRALRFGFSAESAKAPPMVLDDVTVPFRVSIQYQDSTSAPAIGRLASGLKKRGYEVEPAQRVVQKTKGDVRFTRPQDAGPAAQLALDVNALLQESGLRTRVRPLDISRSYPDAPARQMEVWIPWEPPLP